MKTKKTSSELVVYWAPAAFLKDVESWNMVYEKPKSVFSKLVDNKTHNGRFTMCPATKDLLKNTFSFNSAIDDNFSIDSDFLKEVAEEEQKYQPVPNTGAILNLLKLRRSSYKGYANVGYNMSWIFFAEESVTAKFTAPYFPPKVPVEDAMMSPGEYDIGNWFRPFNLDYHIPIESEKFNVSKGDELFYLELKTKRKVVFKRFEYTRELDIIAGESVDAPKRYGTNLPLEHRYEMAQNSNLKQRVLKEIKKNLVED